MGCTNPCAYRYTWGTAEKFLTQHTSQKQTKLIFFWSGEVSLMGVENFSIPSYVYVCVNWKILSYKNI